MEFLDDGVQRLEALGELGSGHATDMGQGPFRIVQCLVHGPNIACSGLTV